MPLIKHTERSKKTKVGKVNSLATDREAQRKRRLNLANYPDYSDLEVKDGKITKRGYSSKRLVPVSGDSDSGNKVAE